MRIVVNHLTRMRGGYVCVAGVDPDTLEHVRPVLQHAALPFDLLARYGGPFDIARIVELGTPRPTPERPHVEDYVIVPSHARSRQSLPADKFWLLLRRLSKTGLREIFGSELKSLGQSSCGTDPGKGEASLGCFRPARTPQLCYLPKGPSGRPRVRIGICDGQFEVLPSVTDIRLYQEDHITPDRACVERISHRLQSGEAVILGVGLTRAFAGSAEHKTEPAHWLQVNNIHLESDPTWQLG